jgi:hypothetical protein
MKADYKRLLMILVVVWGGAFLLLLGVHMFLTLPQQKELELLGKQLMEKRLKYDSSKAADSEQAQAQLSEKVSGLTEELGRFAAEVDELDGLWFSISRIASEIGVESFQSRGTDDESYSAIANCYDVGTASVEVNFSGSFNKFARFINQLERYKPVVFVDEFTITRSRKEDSEPEAKLVLSIFVRVPEEDKLEEETPSGTIPAEGII